MASVEPAAAPAVDKNKRLSERFAEYDGYVKRAEELLATGDLQTAAAYCAIASHVATQNHCGIFWSPRAEKVLNEIGRRLEPEAPSRPRPTEIKRILQVCTQVSAVGGHTKMLCQWVRADKDQQRGELVLVLGPALQSDQLSERDRALARAQLEELPLSRAARVLAAHTGLKRQALYNYLEAVSSE